MLSFALLNGFFHINELFFQIAGSSIDTTFWLSETNKFLLQVSLVPIQVLKAKLNKQFLARFESLRNSSFQ